VTGKEIPLNAGRLEVPLKPLESMMVRLKGK